MKINISNATFSSIVGIGEKIIQVEKETGRKFLKLNRGVNMVTNINLDEVVKKIDYNSPEYQLYAPNTGISSLKETIAKEYHFSNPKNISITPGGMPALDLVIQLLHVENIYFPQFYWGSYSKMATIRKKPFSFYNSFLDMDTSKLNDSSGVFVCDPNNPTGIKMDDRSLYQKILDIQNTGAIVVFDSPYRKLFTNDIFGFDNMPNVIVTESFSKWIGLPGARLGFIHSSNEDFNRELNIRLLYEFNGVSSPSQVLVNKLLSTEEGIIAILNFRIHTCQNIQRNISYLSDNGFLPNEIYGETKPLGIFAIVNKSEDFLFQNNIGSVGLEKFVYYEKDMYSSYARVCVSVPHEDFVNYFSKIK